MCPLVLLSGVRVCVFRGGVVKDGPSDAISFLFQLLPLPNKGLPRLPSETAAGLARPRGFWVAALTPQTVVCIVGLDQCWERGARTLALQVGEPDLAKKNTGCAVVFRF